MDLFRTDCIEYVSVFWRIKKKRERCLWAEWIGGDCSLQATQSGVQQGCVRRREETYCMDGQAPGPRPQRCSQDDPSTRRIQISPATHKAAVSFADVVAGIYHRKLPSPQTLSVSASQQNYWRRSYVRLRSYSGNRLGFSKQSKKATLWGLAKEESATWHISNGFQK